MAYNDPLPPRRPNPGDNTGPPPNPGNNAGRPPDAHATNNSGAGGVYGGSYRGSANTGGWAGSTGTVGSSGALPPGFSGSPGEAYTRAVQGNELTSEQLVGLLGRNSPYIQQQENAGYRRANARGIMDSSVGVQAGRSAAIASGLPIAMADAGAYGAAAGQNQQYLNQMAMQHAGDAASLANARVGASASMYGANIGLTNNREQRAYSGEQQGLDRTYGDYMARQGFNEQQIQDYTRQGYGQQNRAMEAGYEARQRDQNFRNDFGLQAMNNPYIMQNPAGAQGFMNWIRGDGAQYMYDLFNFGLGGRP